MKDSIDQISSTSAPSNTSHLDMLLRLRAQGMQVDEELKAQAKAELAESGAAPEDLNELNAVVAGTVTAEETHQLGFESPTPVVPPRRICRG
jgi:hypothetical protein